ncbi:MAG: hypothetical protein PHV17_00320 [Candidatus Omnitrophica bacterium]|nr:hypothetical protein [Candidatus Omnitrophota bacterium]
MRKYKKQITVLLIILILLIAIIVKKQRNPKPKSQPNDWEAVIELTKEEQRAIHKLLLLREYYPQYSNLDNVSFLRQVVKERPKYNDVLLAVEKLSSLKSGNFSFEMKKETKN